MSYRVTAHQDRLTSEVAKYDTNERSIPIENIELAHRSLVLSTICVSRHVSSFPTELLISRRLIRPILYYPPFERFLRLVQWTGESPFIYSILAPHCRSYQPLEFSKITAKIKDGAKEMTYKLLFLSFGTIEIINQHAV